MLLQGNWRLQITVDSGTAVQFVADAWDSTASGVIVHPGYRNTGTSNGATPVDVIAAPVTASLDRRAKYIEITNTDTVTRVVTVRLFDGTTSRASRSWGLPASAAIYWTPQAGWVAPNTATVTGAEAWETRVIASIGAVKCSPGNAIYQMQRAGNVAATPTNISTSVARCSLFRPPQNITVNTIRFYGVGATTSVFRCAIYRLSDLARLTSELVFTTAANTWDTAGTSLNLSLTAGTAYFMACSVNATGTTAGIGCVGGTVAATTGQIATAPGALPGSLQPSLGYLDSYFFQFAVTSGALPETAATLAAQAAWTGGMPLFFLDNA